MPYPAKQCDFASSPRSSLATYARIVLGFVVFMVGMAVPYGGCLVFGQSVVDPRQEYNVKAVFLYSFGRYVVWPDDSLTDGNSFTIGILGGDPFAGALDRIAQKKQISGKRIVIRRFENAADYQPCHILFLSRNVSVKELSAVISKVGPQPVLLVTEAPGFADRGGMINFFLSNDSVRFEINLDATKRQGLSIDAKLLRLAKRVEGA